MSSTVHPQLTAVIKARSLPLGLEVVVDDLEQLTLPYRRLRPLFNIGYNGSLASPEHLRPQKLWGLLDCCDRSASLTLVAARRDGRRYRRWTHNVGVLLGLRPHVAFLASSEKTFVKCPGIMVPKTLMVIVLCVWRYNREQHIRRGKATSNVCGTSFIGKCCCDVCQCITGRQG